MKQEDTKNGLRRMEKARFHVQAPMTDNHRMMKIVKY